MEEINKLSKEMNYLSNKIDEIDNIKETLMIQFGDLDIKLEKMKNEVLKKQTIESDKYNQSEDGKHIYLVIHEVDYTDGNYPEINERIIGIFKSYKEAKKKIHEFVPITTEKNQGHKYKHFEDMESYSIDMTYSGELYAIYKIKIPS